MKKSFDQFTNLYSLSKTLRFELKPTNLTKEHIEEFTKQLNDYQSNDNEDQKPEGVLAQDYKRAEDYKQAKKIIDEYHRDFIDKQLTNFKFDLKDLKSFEQTLENTKKIKKNDELEEQQQNLRKEVHKELYDKTLFEKNFIDEVKKEKSKLLTWLENKGIEKIEGVDGDIKQIIKNFKGWTTYFAGFNKNRENVYTAKEQSTSIGFRLIHDNLPKFIKNYQNYQKAKDLGVDFSKVAKEFGRLDDVFCLKNFNNCLTQKQIEQYNSIIGGYSKQDNTKIKGINETINLYAQQLTKQLKNSAETEKKELRNKIKNISSCKMNELYKQILSKTSSASFVLDSIKNDAELVNMMQKFYVENDNLFINLEKTDSEKGEITQEKINITEKLSKTLKNLTNIDENKVYLTNDLAITNISKNIFSDWSIIKNALEFYVENKKLTKDKKKEPLKKLTSKEQEKRLKEQEKWLKKSYFSFNEIHQALETYFKQFDDELDNNVKDDSRVITLEIKQKAINQPLIKYFQNLTIKRNNKQNQLKDLSLLDSIKEAYQKVSTILKKYEQEKEEKLKAEKTDVEKIKDYLDTISNLQRFLKPLFVESAKDELEKDNSFYADFDNLYKHLKNIIPLYNKARNYLTKKSFSQGKYKLNFDNQTLAGGWDKNKETDNTSILLMKDNKYYLAIMDKKYNKLFSQDNLDIETITNKINQNKQLLAEKQKELKTKNQGTKIYTKLEQNIKKLTNEIKEQQQNLDLLSNTSDTYHKIVYKQISDANKDIQNLVNIDGEITKFTKNLNAIKQKYCPEIYRIRKTETYKGKDIIREDLDKFINYYKTCAKSYWEWANLKFKNNDKYKNFKEFTDDINHQGYKITFEKISSSYINQCLKTGKLYLFQIYNKDFSIHSKGKPNLHTMYWRMLFDNENLVNVVYKLNGEAEIFYRSKSLNYSKEIWEKGHHANEPNKKQPYPIIKDKRYAENKFFFHCPISLNFKPKHSSGFKFNKQINQLLKYNPDIKILGIDRGERHLAYYSLIDQQGNIIQQDSFNNPTEKKDYHDLLNKREKQRDDARKSWGTIENIKELKHGYLSIVVHEIAKLVIEHNAIVVFEDLNFGFKRGRFKVEKQIYQKLEKMLIDKLNYLVFKDKKADQVGGVLKAYQLTAPFKSFSKMGKQTGIIFYVPAYHTSKICPATGFVNLLYPKHKTIKKTKEFIKKFDSIKYNSKEDYFEFAINYKQFGGKVEGCKPKWTIYSYSKRLENFRNKEKNNQWDTREVNLTQELKDLFENKINYKNSEELKDDLIAQTEGKFFKDFIRLLKLTLQIRNSKINTNEDWLITPVKDSKGEFFDSRELAKDSKMPKDADANGAYHIALKGLWAKKQIDKTDEKNLNKPKLAISNKDWYEFIQAKNYIK